LLAIPSCSTPRPLWLQHLLTCLCFFSSTLPLKQAPQDPCTVTPLHLPPLYSGKKTLLRIFDCFLSLLFPYSCWSIQCSYLDCLFIYDHATFSPAQVILLH
jgi:hypothetical protein